MLNNSTSLRRTRSCDLATVASEKPNLSHLCCPITHAPLLDPVAAGDGFTYERWAIKQWLATHSTSPMTRELLPHTHLVPNIAVRTLLLSERRPGAAALQQPRCDVKLPSTSDIWRHRLHKVPTAVISGVQNVTRSLQRGAGLGRSSDALRKLGGFSACLASGALVGYCVYTFGNFTPTTVRSGDLNEQTPDAWLQAGTQLQALCRGLPAVNQVLETTQRSACEWLASLSLPQACMGVGSGDLGSCASLTGTQIAQNPSQETLQAITNQAFYLATAHAEEAARDSRNCLSCVLGYTVSLVVTALWSFPYLLRTAHDGPE